MRRRSSVVSKKRTTIIATVLCLVSAVAMAGVYRLEQLKSTEEEFLVNWEESADKDESQLRKSIDEPDTIATTAPNKEQTSSTEAIGNDALSLEEEYEDTALAEEEEETAEVGMNHAVALNFNRAEKLAWPVRGNIVLDYSMDASIYFPTLQQYKYNPAIIIQSEVGTEVVAAAAGKVDSIVQSDETGLTMTIDMGNNFKAVYGQLQSVNLSTGSLVEQGQVIATVSEPSKYYLIEGCNVYFQVLENDVPVDPLSFME